MTEDNSYEYYVEYCKSKFAHWIPRSHIEGECTEADLDRNPVKTAEEVVLEKKIKVVEKAAVEWNLVGEYYFAEVKDENKELKKPRRIKWQQEVYLGLNIRLTPCYPSDYMRHHGMAPTLYLCNKCFYPHTEEGLLYDHMENKCKNFKQPGRVIYEEAEGDVLYRFYEVDGLKHEMYCQQLCLFAKFFIDSKTICYAVRDFFFYILTKTENDKEQAVGYFSKNRNFAYNPDVKENLSVILVFPPFVRKGFAFWLIDLSNKIGMKQGKCGTPETPISEFGSYAYWR